MLKLYNRGNFMGVTKIIAIGLIALSLSFIRAQDGTTDIAMKDADGNTYYTVKIGNQVWTTENLKTTKYNDGTPIPLVKKESKWDDREKPGYCWYGKNWSKNNRSEFRERIANTANFDKYGALYNWYVVNTGKLAPKGWHVPTNADWDTLEHYLFLIFYSDYHDSRYRYKETDDYMTNYGFDWMITRSLMAGTDWWSSFKSLDSLGSRNNRNRSNFWAYPGGRRSRNGDFKEIGFATYWWSATDSNEYIAYQRCIGVGEGGLREEAYCKSCGLSVRLLRD
jgi:uncharacterized protein (TIGR02145 family)